MFMRDFDLKALELQLYGYDAALDDTGTLGDHDRFNASFAEYLRSNHRLSCPEGWARALLAKCGTPEQAFSEFLALLKGATSSA
jgi:hypothetical protein